MTPGFPKEYGPTSEAVGTAAWMTVEIVYSAYGTASVRVRGDDKDPLPVTSARALAALINVACDIVERRNREKRL